MKLALRDGKLILRDGKLGLADSCCCGQPPCSGPCETSGDCGSKCECVDGTCAELPRGCCCDGCEVLANNVTQQECLNTLGCFEFFSNCEYQGLDNSGACPPGFVAKDGYCERCTPCPPGSRKVAGGCISRTVVTSCAECSNFCSPISSVRWESPCNNCEGYFHAFDGSNRRFRKFGYYDLDCCYLPGSGPPDDGYYVLKKCADGQLVVVDSARWYAANGFAIGSIVSQFDLPNLVDTGHPNNSATWLSLESDSACCNADGLLIYAELTEEVNPLP